MFSEEVLSKLSKIKAIHIMLNISKRCSITFGRDYFLTRTITIETATAKRTATVTSKPTTTTTTKTKATLTVKTTATATANITKMATTKTDRKYTFFLVTRIAHKCVQIILFDLENNANTHN